MVPFSVTCLLAFISEASSGTLTGRDDPNTFAFCERYCSCGERSVKATSIAKEEVDFEVVIFSDELGGYCFVPVNEEHDQDEFDDIPSQNETHNPSRDSETHNSSGDSETLLITPPGIVNPALAKATLVTADTPTSSPCRCIMFHCGCSSRQLDTVPQNLPALITHLSLRNNSLTSLPNDSFSRYARLTYLDLSSNRLQRLEVGSFEGLSRLEFLNLKNNSLILRNGTFPRGVFRPLIALKTLWMNRNTIYPDGLGNEYPDGVLSELTSLINLSMDGLANPNFGVGFRNMTSLRNLSLNGYHYGQGYCTVLGLTNETFENLNQLTTLDISTCKIYGDDVESGAFLPLKNLTDLDISYNFNFRFDNFNRIMAGLRDFKILSLKLNTIVSLYSQAVTVNRSIIDSLPKSLEHLEAKGNSFEMIESGLLHLAPENLSFVDLGNNRIIYGLYLMDLTNLKNLKSLRLQGGMNIQKLPTYEVSTTQRLHLSPWHARGFPKNISGMIKLVIKLPGKLEQIDMSVAGLRYIISTFSIDPNNMLKNLTLNNNYFPCLLGPVFGLEKLEVLDLRFTSATTIKLDFFKNFRGLRRLFLGNNELGPFFGSLQPNARIFSFLNHLEELDISTNGIESLPSNLLSGLDRLTSLNIANNRMLYFNLSISSMTNLTLLNLSHSQLSQMPDHVIHHIDVLVNGKVNVKVDMSSNAIKCDCQNVNFIQWMVSSPAFDPNFKNYMCQYPDTSYKYITDSYEETLRMLRRSCAQNFRIFVAAISATIFLLCAVVGAIIYRFRWKIKYLYYAAYLRLKDQNANRDNHNFRYDVFLSYSSEDEEFVTSQILTELSSRGLKLHVHGRDFAVGDYITSNIVTAIKESRRTLVILTRNLLASKWCNYELQMANMESVYTGRTVLVFLLMETIPSTELGTDLLYHIRNNTYTLYPGMRDGPTLRTAPGIFWEKLARDLKH